MVRSMWSPKAQSSLTSNLTRIFFLIPVWNNLSITQLLTSCLPGFRKKHILTM